MTQKRLFTIFGFLPGQKAIAYWSPKKESLHPMARVMHCLTVNIDQDTKILV